MATANSYPIPLSLPPSLPHLPPACPLSPLPPPNPGLHLASLRHTLCMSDELPAVLESQLQIKPFSRRLCLTAPGFGGTPVCHPVRALGLDPCPALCSDSPEAAALTVRRRRACVVWQNPWRCFQTRRGSRSTWGAVGAGPAVSAACLYVAPCDVATPAIPSRRTGSRGPRPPPRPRSS